MAVAIAVGLLLARAASPASVHVLVGLAALLAVPAWSARLPRLGTVAVVAALLLVAVARGEAYRGRLEQGQAGLIAAGEWIRVRGRVSEPPADAASEPLVVVAVEACDRALPFGARLRLRCPAGTRLEWSDRVTGLAWVASPEPPRNPGGFDGVAFARANALVASGRFVWCRVTPARGFAAWPRATFGRARTAIERRLAARLKPQARAIVWPLVLGDRSEMPPGLAAELRVAGLVHLIALSGLHVGWLAELMRALAAVLGLGLGGRALAGAACALGYAGLAGSVPSLARAAASELIGACAGSSSRRVDPLQALALSVALLLAVFPAWAFDLGFQLSCTATLGLAAVGAVAPHVPRRFAGVVAALLSTLGAQLVSLPLLLASFHLLAWISPAANLVAVPVAGWLLSAAWLALIADLAIPGLGGWWFGACNALSLAFAWIVEHAARVPGAARAAGHDGLALLLAGVGAVLIAAACARRVPPAAEFAPPGTSARAWWGVACCAMALVLAAWGSEMRPPRGRAWLVALDVGQGDALALGFHDGWWLVDAGGLAPRFDAGEQVVLPFLRWAGVQSLAGVVITHDDSDHSGGVPAVLHGVPVRRVVVPAPLAGQPPPLGRFLGRFHGRASHAGDTLHRDPELTVLWPPPAGTPFEVARGITADNAGGVVLQCGEGAGSALLLADVDSTVEARLVIAAGVGVLKAAHHGSATSSGASFLTRAHPSVIVLSCGRRNRFGHPDPGALRRLNATGARIERTDQSGAKWFELTEQGVRTIDWVRCDPRQGQLAITSGTSTAPHRE